MSIDNMLWYARIGIYYSISRNSLCKYPRNFKIIFWNKNYAVAFITFYQYFLLWISFLNKFWLNLKECKSLTKSYRPISLLPIVDIIFQRLIYKDLFNHFNWIIFSWIFFNNHFINLPSHLMILAFSNCCILFMKSILFRL